MFTLIETQPSIHTPLPHTNPNAGMEGGYWLYLLSPPTKAPSYKFVVFSPSTLQQSIFVWTPGLNEASQGTMVQNEWRRQNFTENTGTSGNWPVPTGGTTGGDDGWWCSQQCLMGFGSGYITGASVKRNLRTFVEGLLSLPVTSSASVCVRERGGLIGLLFGMQNESHTDFHKSHTHSHPSFFVKTSRSRLQGMFSVLYAFMCFTIQ